MQRTAVNRVGDLIAIVVYSVFLAYNLRWITTYTYEVFWLHQSTHLLDLVLFSVLTLLIGYWWGVYLWSLLKYKTFPWFFRNLRVYSGFLFWRTLTDVMMWITARLMVVASWMSEHAYPGRGFRVSFNFDDERDFTEAMQVTKDLGIPLADGRALHPEEYDASLSHHDLLEGVYYRAPRDADIIQNYPPIATLGVVDANPATHRDD